MESHDKSAQVEPMNRGSHILVGLTLLTFVVDLLFLAIAIHMVLATAVPLSQAVLFTSLALLCASAVLVALHCVTSDPP